jgi:hypothetical protein
MTKKQRKAEIAAGTFADDSCSEEEAGVTIDAAAVPPMKGSWEPVEFKIFVQNWPPTGAACRPELAFVASAKSAMDAVELPCDGKVGVRSRTAQRRAGWRQER